MASQIVTCECGRKLRVDERHAGKAVRCPACRRTFAVPPQAEENIPLVLPAAPPEPPGEQAEEEIVSAPRPRKAPPPATYRIEETVGGDEDVEVIEEGQPRPRKKRRPRPSGVRSFFASLGSKLQGEQTVRLLLGGFVGGVVVLAIAFVEGRLSGAALATPQTLPLARLAADGPGNNAHVLITDFLPCDNFVYQYRGSTTHWEAVYVPVVPRTPDILARLGPGPMGKPTIPPGSIRVIVHSTKVHSQADLPRVFDQPTIQGTVVNSIRSLDNKTQELLRGAYPGADFGSCYILQEGRTPSSAASVVLLALLGTLLLVTTGLLLAARFLFRNEV